MCAKVLRSTRLCVYDKGMTTTSTANLTIVKVEDHEFEGRCSHCGRENVRWITTLSNGQTVGVECVKKLLGITFAPKSYTWTAHFTPIAEHTEYGETFVLWQSKTGTQTRETRNGNLTCVGGVRSQWERKGWAA